MAVSRVVLSELGYALRLLFSTVPSLRAPAEQRSDWFVLKAEVYEYMAATHPGIAAQVMQVADKARREAHAIHIDY